ncbi:MAG: DUF1648 domain-containing protein [Terracidiphilus sp.]|jgi:hypothetical protein
MRKSLEVISMMVLVWTGWITWQALHGAEQLPARIAIHFDAAGNPNGWGEPSMLPLFPAVAVVLYLGMTLAARFPAFFNYPVAFTAENRPRLEALALDLIAWLKMEMVCLFAWIQWSIIEMARRGRGDLSAWLIPVSMGVIFATVAWFIVAMRRAACAKSDS